MRLQSNPPDVRGLLPPMDLDAEAGVLARGLEGDTTALDALRFEQFFSGEHGTIFIALHTARELRGRTDVATVATMLRAVGCFHLRAAEAREALYELVDEHAWGTTVDVYVARVIGAWRARETAWSLERAAALIRTGSDPGRVLAATARDLKAFVTPRAARSSMTLRRAA